MSFISRVKTAGRRWPARAVAVAATAVLTACGGGSDGLSCSVADEKVWLREYFEDWYFWYASSPRPDPSAYASVDAYFQALLYPGGLVPGFPEPDTWSNMVSEDDFNLTYGEGRAMGYGVFVTGIEVQGRPDLPLYIRYLDPGSPGAVAGLARGDQILSVNGRPASDMIAADDYSALVAQSVGSTATLVVRNADGDRTVTLNATVYDLVPVQGTQVITTPDGRKMGYVMVKDMIEEAVSPIDVAFGQFKAQGIQDVMLDLRYNGGGLVSVAEKIASFPNGPATSGQVFANLLYNDKRAPGYNESFRFRSYANAAGLSRVYVLTGPRTCSSSESVINGLRPFVEVITVGDTTCGKPVGTLPTPDGCGAVVNAINFESVNARNEGRYFDGFDAVCAVAEDFGEPIGGVNDPLRIAAEDHADGFACTTGVAGARPGGRVQALAQKAGGTSKVLGLPLPAQRLVAGKEPAERGGMFKR